MFNLFSQIDIELNDLKIPRPELPVDAKDVENLAIVNIAFGLLAAVAVLVIVISGVQFILSRGDPQKAANARNTIIYASIGLVLGILAFSIVRFVLGRL